MTRSEQFPIIRHMTIEDVDRNIKSLEKSVRVLKRWYFLKYRYLGDSVEVASEKVGVTKMVGYIWQKRWNEGGPEGIFPHFAGGRPSKLSDMQKEDLKKSLSMRDDWNTEEVRELISSEYDVLYTPKQVRIILRKFGLKNQKPYPRDHKRPDDAEDDLKKTMSDRDK